VNLTHLTLFNQFTTDTFKLFGSKEAHAALVREKIIAFGLKHGFLMYEMLALASYHLAVLSPERRSFYTYHASALQSQALSEYRSVASNMTEAASYPSLLFSVLLGHHVIFESLSHHELGFDDYMSGITQAMNLVRGTRAVISAFWDTLQQSDLAPVLIDQDIIANAKADGQGALDLPILQSLLATTLQQDQDHVALSACSTAVERLAWLSSAISMMDAEAPDAESSRSNSLVISWPITVPEEYCLLLYQQNPVALILMAHYAMLLHQRRRSWMVGDSPIHLIQAIASHLGPSWEQWLSQPIQAISI
jgi:hypothetical protein